MLTRRDFGRLALAGVPAATLWGRGQTLAGAVVQAKPGSLIDGVQIGAITYSYRSMPDQSAAATLKYILDSGISAIELMGGPVESFAGAPAMPGGRRGPGGGSPPPAATGGPMGTWNGKPCALPTARAGGGGGGGRRELTPEQQEHASKLRAWRTSVSMDPFKRLRTMFNDAGVSIYAWKQLSTSMSDEEAEYVFNVAEALGCTHTTLELPTDPTQLKRLGDLGAKKKIYAAYHTHLQGNMTAFDQAFLASPGNQANVDFGHWVAAGNVGGTPMQFLEKYHSRIASIHLKDRTTPEHCALNLPWGTGETPIVAILQALKKNRWSIPASIELEYDVPEGSDAVKEVRRCVDYCRTALTKT
jgi:sugar phosphate isomerase/epimerase